MMNLRDRLCVVVGAGAVARRKVEGLLQSQARVRWVAPNLIDDIGSPQLEVHSRPYRAGDLAGAVLAFAATDDPEVHDKIHAEAERTGVLVNRAEQPERGDFTVPAVIRQGPILLSVSTGGVAPALSALLRDRLRNQVDPAWAKAAALAEELREHLIRTQGDAASMRALLQAWLTEDTLMLLRQERLDDARKRLWESVPSDKD